MKKIALTTLLLLLIVGHANADSPIKRGQALYMKVGCYQCHGTVGQGSVAGVRLAPQPMAWDAFAQFVRNTSDAMPAYRENVLADADLKDIHTYLLSVPNPQAVDQIRLLRGKK
jgi:mono/diheme cytochrome c family protein